MKKSRVFGILVISLVILSLSFSFVSASWFSDFWAKITGNAVAKTYDCRVKLGNQFFTGFHNVVGLSNGDTRFVCHNQRLYECGWELNNNKFAKKMKDGQKIGNWQCDLNNKKLVLFNQDCEKSLGGLLYKGKNGVVGLDNKDSRFLCLSNNFYECGWELNNSNFAIKSVNNQVVANYKCNLNSSKWEKITSSSSSYSSLNMGQSLLGVMAGIHSGNFYPGFNLFYYRGNISGPYYNDSITHNGKKYIISSSNKKLVLDEGWNKSCDLYSTTALEACQKIYPDANYAVASDIDFFLLTAGINISSQDGGIASSLKMCDYIAGVNPVVTSFCNELRQDILVNSGLTSKYHISFTFPGYPNWSYCGVQNNFNTANNQMNTLSASLRRPYALFCYKFNETPQINMTGTVIKDVCEDSDSSFNIFNSNTISIYRATYNNGVLISKNLLNQINSQTQPRYQYMDNISSYTSKGINDYIINAGLSKKYYCIKRMGAESDSYGSIDYIPCKYGVKDGRCCYDFEDISECGFKPGRINKTGVLITHEVLKKVIGSNVDLSVYVSGASSPQVYLYYKSGTEVSSEGWNKVEMTNSGNNKWSYNLALNNINIPNSAKNLVYNGQLEGNYGLTNAGHAAQGSIIPCVGSSFVEWKNGNVTEASGAQCASGKCQKITFDVAKYCPPQNANQGKVGNGCDVSYFVGLGDKPLLSDAPYVARAKIKQTGGDSDKMTLVVALSSLAQQYKTINYFARFNNPSQGNYIAYNGVKFLGDDMREDWKIYFNNIPTNKTLLGTENEWKQMEWLFKIPQVIYSSQTQIRFIMSNAPQLWLDNIEVAPLYPGIQYYIEVIDGDNKYYENSWLYDKVINSNNLSFIPTDNPHFVITSETPLTITPNQPSASEEQANNRCVNLNCQKANGGITHTGVNNVVGLSNGDPRFLCFETNFYECGWTDNNPQFAIKAVNNRVVGSWKCNLPNKRWVAI